MRAVVLAILAALAVPFLGMPVLFGLAWLVYGDAVPDSLLRLASSTLFALALAVFWIVRRKAPGSPFVDRMSALVLPQWPKAPLERIFLLIAIVGALGGVLTVFSFHSAGNSAFGRVLLDPPWYYRGYFYAFWASIAVTVVGCLGAFYYERSLGRIVRWIKGA